MTTLLALKNRKAMLESCMEIEEVADGDVSEKTLVDYMAICARLVFAERQLLKPFDRCARCKHLHD